MHSLRTNTLRSGWTRLLLPALLALGACRSGARSEPPQPGPDPPRGQQSVPDVVRTTFQANVSLPTVVSLTPTLNEQNVQRGTAISATFDVAMQPASTANAFSVTAGGVPVPGTTSYLADSKQIVFQPAEPLPANSSVEVVLGPTLSTAGVETSGSFWSFTTGS